MFFTSSVENIETKLYFTVISCLHLIHVGLKKTVNNRWHTYLFHFWAPLKSPVYVKLLSVHLYIVIFQDYMYYSVGLCRFETNIVIVILVSFQMHCNDKHKTALIQEIWKYLANLYWNSLASLIDQYVYF